MKHGIKRIILAVITIVLLYFVFSNINLRELADCIKTVDCKYIILLVITIVTALSLRGLCFKQLIYKSANIPFKDAALLCLTCSAFNIIFPARAGDVFRAYFAGKKYGVDKVKVFGAVIFERILDMIAIATFLAIAVCIYKKSDLAVHLCIFAVIFIFCGFVFALIGYKYADINGFCNKINEISEKFPGSGFIKKIMNFINRIMTSFCAGFEILDSPKHLLLTVITSFSIWFVECLNYVVALWAFHIDVHLSVTIFVTCFIVFAGLIPSTSIFLGPAQIAVISAFALYGINKETALAVSILEQGVCTIICTIIAVIFLWQNNLSLEKIRENS